MNQSAVMIVDEDVVHRRILRDAISLAGYRVLESDNSDDALNKICSQDITLVLSDTDMRSLDGHAMLRNLKSLKPTIPVILMSAYTSVRAAVQAMQEGAEDYLVKPVASDSALELVRRTIASTQVRDDELVAVDPRSRELVNLATRVAKSEVTVMITGDTGSGKEVFARYIHRHSKRSKGPFVAVNCAALPDNMLEALLFGYEKGAFTGAYETKRGKFEQAEGGTLLLDEISELDLGLQAKLLRVLQEKEVERLGGHKIIPLNVRILATSNRNLSQYVRENKVREDLYYRLNVFPLRLPALRDRPGDILPLAHRFTGNHRSSPLSPITAAAERLLLSHSWPGNVRELDNLIQRALVLKSGEVIMEEDIQFEPETAEQAGVSTLIPFQGTEPERLENNLKTKEQELILNALISGNGNRKRAAAALGISPRTLRYKLARMREAGVPIPD